MNVGLSHSSQSKKMSSRPPRRVAALKSQQQWQASLEGIDSDEFDEDQDFVQTDIDSDEYDEDQEFVTTPHKRKKKRQGNRSVKRRGLQSSSSSQPATPLAARKVTAKKFTTQSQPKSTQANADVQRHRVEQLIFPKIIIPSNLGKSAVVCVEVMSLLYMHFVLETNSLLRKFDTAKTTWDDVIGLGERLARGVLDYLLCRGVDPKKHSVHLFLDSKPDNFTLAKGYPGPKSEKHKPRIANAAKYISYISMGFYIVLYEGLKELPVDWTVHFRKEITTEADDLIKYFLCDALEGLQYFVITNDSDSNSWPALYPFPDIPVTIWRLLPRTKHHPQEEWRRQIIHTRHAASMAVTRFYLGSNDYDIKCTKETFDDIQHAIDEHWEQGSDLDRNQELFKLLHQLDPTVQQQIESLDEFPPFPIDVDKARQDTIKFVDGLSTNSSSSSSSSSGSASDNDSEEDGSDPRVDNDDPPNFYPSPIYPAIKEMAKYLDNLADPYEVNHVHESWRIQVGDGEKMREEVEQTRQRHLKMEETFEARRSVVEKMVTECPSDTSTPGIIDLSSRDMSKNKTIIEGKRGKVKQDELVPEGEQMATQILRITPGPVLLHMYRVWAERCQDYYNMMVLASWIADSNVPRIQIKNPDVRIRLLAHAWIMMRDMYVPDEYFIEIHRENNFSFQLDRLAQPLEKRNITRAMVAGWILISSPCATASRRYDRTWGMSNNMLLQAIKDFTIARKAAFTNLKRGNITHFRMQTRSRKTRSRRVMHVQRESVRFIVTNPSGSSDDVEGEDADADDQLDSDPAEDVDQDDLLNEANRFLTCADSMDTDDWIPEPDYASDDELELQDELDLDASDDSDEELDLEESPEDAEESGRNVQVRICPTSSYQFIQHYLPPDHLVDEFSELRSLSRKELNSRLAIDVNMCGYPMMDEGNPPSDIILVDQLEGRRNQLEIHMPVARQTNRIEQHDASSLGRSCTLDPGEIVPLSAYSSIYGRTDLGRHFTRDVLDPLNEKARHLQGTLDKLRKDIRDKKDQCGYDEYVQMRTGVKKELLQQAKENQGGRTMKEILEVVEGELAQWDNDRRSEPIQQIIALNRRKNRLTKRIRRLRKKMEDAVDRAHYEWIHELFRRYDTVFIPEFGGSKGMRKTDKYGRRRKIGKTTVRRLVSLRHCTFRDRLIFVAKRLGKTVIVCREEYSTCTCMNCGNAKNNISGSAREWKCKCGAKHHRDGGAARTIWVMNAAQCF
eukprot:TRINITY_DN9439_c0_g1_i3.p1 TRINITY_DN9439_c0_g1~~TRINITY_DN9439_c0_g1_i3.p1  ORF type:complete len:1240 (+),score=230.09 TRINITY_DN9439_c0_g1_i3:1194-4913(+)